MCMYTLRRQREGRGRETEGEDNMGKLERNYINFMGTILFNTCDFYSLVVMC